MLFDRLLYHIRQYFGFSRYETYGVLLLLVLITCALFLPYLISYYENYRQAKVMPQVVHMRKGKDKKPLSYHII